METHHLVIVGAGGFATQVIETFKANKVQISGLVDDDRTEPVLGCPILGTLDDLKSGKIISRSLFCAIRDLEIRERIYKDFIIGWTLNCIHPSANISQDVKLGFGNYIGPGAVIMSQTKIGDNNIIEPLVVVSYNTVIGNHNHLKTHSCLLENVKIGNRNLIGVRSTILPNLELGHQNVIPEHMLYETCLTQK